MVGLTPVLQAGGARLGEMLGGAARAGGGRRSRLRTALTVTQAALSVVLLVGAGLFVRSLLHVNALSLGMQPDRVLAVDESWARLPAADEATRSAALAAREARFDATLERIAAMPGVEAAAITVGTPFRSRFSMPLRVPGWDSLPRLAGGGPYLAAISPRFFATMGTRVRQGREFGAMDRRGGEPVAIVNETMARTLWPGGRALGNCLHVGDESDSTSAWCRRVVGVVEDVRRSNLREEPAMQYYLPLGQESGIGGRQLLVRPKGPAREFRGALRTAVVAALPELLHVEVQPFTSYLDPLMRPWRLGATLFGLFGVLALAVAALGLYSVMAYTVAQRTHELGVRRALGAGASHLRRLILVRGVLTVGAGCAIGAALALAGGPFLGGLLFETSPRDGLVFGTVVVTMLATAVLACIVPARRAAGVDPAIALRAD
jgi:predicted permease